MTQRRCLDCGSLVARTATRCTRCARTRQAAADARVNRPSGGSWQKVRDAILERDGGICWLCGLPGATSADHVIPLAHGGHSKPDNLRAAHISCNSARGSRTPNRK